ncbi:hypothetical protein CAPTEDRAFT_21664 [Capitella teleta]|uniref:peptidyl-tRNA hydrolase n=1 Tax=Capitella teleta TaxID=283909 RepID=R7UU59_CAPTE|nr:hypothetical protein CAPTEDRAFT_21664 [Capitella teleta]|eukprot:ELU07457.1 hypothetical protein CAPTEDRAFT_21664 [Capitella teleta]
MSEAGGGSGIPGDAGANPGFVPKQDLLQAIVSMGISRNAATRGLYYTGNYNADLAAAWIFENQDTNVDAPLDFDSSSDEDDADLSGFVDESELYKMVLIVNSDLNMGVGKVGAQCAHGAVGLYKTLLEDQSKYGEMLLSWEQFGETKIVLKGNNTSHLMELAAHAATLDLPKYLVHDAGKTQIPAGSMTVLAILGKIPMVNQISGALSLL